MHIFLSENLGSYIPPEQPINQHPQVEAPEAISISIESNPIDPPETPDILVDVAEVPPEGAALEADVEGSETEINAGLLNTFPPHKHELVTGQERWIIMVRNPVL